MASLAVGSAEKFFEQFPGLLEFFEIGTKVFAIEHDDVQHCQTEAGDVSFAAAESNAGDIGNTGAFTVFQVGQIKFGTEKTFADALLFQELLQLNQGRQTDANTARVGVKSKRFLAVFIINEHAFTIVLGSFKNGFGAGKTATEFFGFDGCHFAADVHLVLAGNVEEDLVGDSAAGREARATGFGSEFRGVNHDA